MNDYKLMKLLKDKKVADAYQYFEACAYKLHLAELSYFALEKVIAQYQANEKSVVEKVFEDACVGSIFDKNMLITNCEEKRILERRTLCVKILVPKPGFIPCQY